MYSILILLQLLSCTNKSSEVLSYKSQPESKSLPIVSPTTQPKLVTCDTTAYEQLAKWTMDSGAELSVCKFGDTFKLSESEFSGWVNVFHKTGETFTPLMSEVKSELPSELYTFNVKKVDGSRIQVTRSIRSSMEEAGGESTPATEAFIECDRTGCRLGKETCINSKVHKIDGEAVTRLEGVRAKKIKMTEVGYYDILVGKVLLSALAGDRRALTVLTGKNAVQELKLDGASAEIYEDGMRAIDQLKKINCLGK